ncbi:DUF4232 domain-containing protein [Streptacidiphilus carbonis]|uniref:DUF4232 domain-containing protein n=1 Tax=Streptacidiphilus carbonis TaxID=105422 RepID=UPI0005A73EF1|nr:DUF4232 domain-containing protein [Streptacidiphilus carbonis]
MRVKNIPALALLVAAAGVSLTACGSSTGASASAKTSPSAVASSSAGSLASTPAAPAPSSSPSTGSTGGQGSTSGSSSSGSSTAGGTGSGISAQAPSSASSPKCKTDNLGYSVVASGTKNEIVVSMKNNGSSTCSMHGFPGVQLIGPNGLGDTGPDAARTDASGSTVTVGPGEETRFLLDYLPATSGSTKTYTRLLVTPPNETVGQIVNLNALAITIPTPDAQSPDVFVYPIGYHTGYGK